MTEQSLIEVYYSGCPELESLQSPRRISVRIGVGRISLTLPHAKLLAGILEQELQSRLEPTEPDGVAISPITGRPVTT